MSDDFAIPLLIPIRDNKRARWARHGKRNVDRSGDNVVPRLEALILRDDVSDEHKVEADSLLKTVDEHRIMPTEKYERALELIRSYKIIPQSISRRHAKLKRDYEKFVNALTFACQACENLAVYEDYELKREDKRQFAAKLNAASVALLEVQRKLLENEDDHQT